MHNNSVDVFFAITHQSKVLFCLKNNNKAKAKTFMVQILKGVKWLNYYFYYF